MDKANHIRVPRNAQIQQAVRTDRFPAARPRPRKRSILRNLLLLTGIVLTLMVGLVSYNIASTINKIFVAPSRTVTTEPVAGVVPEENEPAVTPTAVAQNPVIINQPGADPTQTPAVSKRITFVLLGVDQRSGETITGTRSDTIMILSIDPATKSAGLLSIPRDLLVQIPGYEPNKINVAHALGGPELVKKTIEYNFGIKVNYYARVNFGGFTRLIDSLGGVDINVPYAIHDNQYPVGDTNKVTTIDFQPGMQHMDGTRALIYARTRHQDSDFGRIQRQQQILLAARNQALQGSTLLHWMDIMNSLGDTVQTDMPLSMVPDMINLGREISSDSIRNRVIDASMVTGASSSSLGQYLVPHWPAIKEVVQEVIYGD